MNMAAGCHTLTCLRRTYISNIYFFILLEFMIFQCILNYYMQPQRLATGNLQKTVFPTQIVKIGPIPKKGMSKNEPDSTQQYVSFARSDVTQQKLSVKTMPTLARVPGSYFACCAHQLCFNNKNLNKSKTVYNCRGQLVESIGRYFHDSSCPLSISRENS